MYSESFMLPPVRTNLQDIFWMNELFADRGGFMSAHQMVPVFEVRWSFISPQHVDPFDHPACRVLLGGAQLGFDAFAEYGYRPVAVPLGGVVSFGIGFAQQYSQHGRAGQALFESGVATILDLGFSLLNPIPYPIRVMTHMAGSFAVYARDRFINEHSFDFTTEFSSERLIEAAGGNPDLALLYYGDYGDARLECLGAIQSSAFIHEFSDWVARGAYRLFGNTAGTTETFTQQRSSMLDSFHLNVNSMNQPLLSFAPGANGYWYPAMAPASAGMLSFTNAGEHGLWLLTEDQSLIVINQEDLNCPRSNPRRIELPRLSGDHRLFRQEGFSDRLRQSLTYTDRNYAISGVPRVRFDNSDQIVIGVEILLGMGKLTLNPFVIVGTQAIALGIYATTKFVKNKKQKKLIGKINDRSQDLAQRIDKMNGIAQGIGQLVGNNDFTAAGNDIKKWRYFRLETIEKIEKLEEKYRKLAKQKDHRTECNERIDSLEKLKYSLYEQDAQHQAIISIGQSQAPALNAEVTSLIGNLNHMLGEVTRQFENRDHVELGDIDAKASALKNDLEGKIKQLRGQYQTLQDKATTKAERECFSKELKAVEKQLVSVNQCTQQIPYLIDHLILEKQLFTGLVLSSLAEIFLHASGYQEHWVSDVLEVAQVFLINEIDFQRSLTEMSDNRCNTNRLSQLTLLRKLQVAGALTKFLLHARGHQAHWVDDILGITGILIKNDKKIQIESIGPAIKTFISHAWILNGSHCLSMLRDLGSMGVECFGNLEPLSKLYVSNFLLNLAGTFGGERIGSVTRPCQVVVQGTITGILIDQFVHGERTIVRAHGILQNFMNLFSLGLRAYANYYKVNLISNNPYRLFDDTKVAAAILFHENYQRQQSWLSRLLSSYSLIETTYKWMLSALSKNSSVAKILSKARIPVLNELISFFGMVQMGFHIGNATFDTYNIRKMEELIDKGKSAEAFKLINEALAKSPNNELIQAVKEFYILQQEMFYLELGMYLMSNGVDFLFDQASARHVSQLLFIVNQMMQQYHLYGLQILKHGYKTPNQFSLQQLYSKENLQIAWSIMGRIEKARIFIQVAKVLVMISMDEIELTSRNRMYLQGVLCLGTMDILLMPKDFYTALTPSDAIRMFAGLLHSAFGFYRSYWNDYYEQHPGEAREPFSFSYQMTEMVTISILSNPFFRGAFYLSGLNLIMNRFGRVVPWVGELAANNFLGNALPHLNSSMQYLAILKLSVDLFNGYRIISRRDELGKIEKLMREDSFDDARKLLNDLKDPWEKDANKVFKWVFGVDWVEENINKLYLKNLVRMHDGLMTENDVKAFGDFLSEIESSSLPLKEKLMYARNVLNDISEYQTRVSQKHGERFLKYLDSLAKGETDSHDRMDVYWQKGLIRLFIFDDRSKGVEYIEKSVDIDPFDKSVQQVKTIYNRRKLRDILEHVNQIIQLREYKIAERRLKVLGEAERNPLSFKLSEVISKDWAEEQLHYMYLRYFLNTKLHQKADPQGEGFKVFLKKLDGSDFPFSGKLQYTEKLVTDLIEHPSSLTAVQGKCLVDFLDKSDSKDISEKNEVSRQRGWIYLGVLQDLTKARELIGDLSVKDPDSKKIKLLDHQLRIVNLRHSMFLLDNCMRLLRGAIGVRGFLFTSTWQAEPTIIHLTMLIQEFNLNQHVKMQQRVHLKNQLLIKKHSVKDKRQIQKEIRDLSTWKTRIVKGEWDFIFRSVNISLLLVGDVTGRRLTDSSRSKKVLDHALVLSELSLWLLQCSHHCRRFIESEDYVEGLVSPDTFYTVGQTISMVNRVFSVMQNYYYPDVLNTRIASLLNSFSNHFYSDYGCRIYSYYFTSQGWMSLYPDWQLLSNVGRSFDPVLDSMREAKDSLVKNIPTLLDFHRWLLPVAHVFFLGWKIYRKCQLDFQYSLASAFLNDSQFDAAYKILSSVETDSLFLKRMKVIAALYKQPSEPGQMQEFVQSLLEELPNQVEMKVVYLQLIAEFSMMLAQQPGSIALHERLDYLKQALHHSKDLLAENPDKEDRQLLHIKLAHQMIFLSTQGDEEEEDSENIDTHRFLTDALDQVKPFLTPDHSIEVQCQANLATGSVYYLRQQEAEQGNLSSLQDCDAAIKHLATAWRLVEENPNLAAKVADDQAIQLLQQLAILACKQHKWSMALTYYEKIKRYPISNEMMREIENHQQALRQQIEIESVQRSMPAWRSMNMFSAASARASSVIVEEVDESNEEQYDHAM